MTAGVPARAGLADRTDIGGGFVPGGARSGPIRPWSAAGPPLVRPWSSDLSCSGLQSTRASLVNSPPLPSRRRGRCFWWPAVKGRSSRRCPGFPPAVPTLGRQGRQATGPAPLAGWLAGQVPRPFSRPCDRLYSQCSQAVSSGSRRVVCSCLTSELSFDSVSRRSKMYLIPLYDG